MERSAIQEKLKPAATESELADIKATLLDDTHHLIRAHEDINALRGDELRRDTLEAKMDHHLQRIEKRLNLADA